MNFARPLLLWLALAAPLAAAGAAALVARRRRNEAAWAARGLWPRLRLGGSPTAAAGIATLVGLATLGTALGLARPRWGESARTVERQGVDIVFVLDTSASMGAYDVTPNRLWLGQNLIRQLVERLPGNRVALVAAEGVGVVMSPLTVDAAVIDLVLDAIEPATLPIPGTRFAPGIERALELFPEGTEKHRVIVLVTDGEDHSEKLERTIEKLRDEHVVAFTLGVGTERGGPVPVPGQAGQFKRDRQGEIVVSHLQPAGLRQLAEATRGAYFAVDSTAFDPQPLVDKISSLERRTIESASTSSLEERFQWPLAAAALALALWLLDAAWGPARRPESA